MKEGDESEINKPSLEDTLPLTDGFGRLSHSQQDFIVSSLNIERRAQDGDLEAQKIIKSRTCFDAIAHLEGYFGEISVDENLDMAPPDFYTGEEFEKPDITTLEAIIKKQSYPCVVIIRSKNGAHGFIVVGGGPNNDVLVWEKIGPNMPFRVVTLEEELRTYYGDTIISLKIRPLKVIE